ncbi:DUF262 domain-containing protein [Oxalobacteraceae bacterium]|nr:DUF262 domain-containing protein [Oxalobacteraceae bacterium]
MSENLTALASENLNPSLRSLLEDVQKGHIRVPRFQRPFVWKDDQRLQLLESIRDNMPIGSLLVWSTSQFELACFPKVGPHEIPSFSAPSLRGRQYLLDGHQRVSTLLGVLLASEPSDVIEENIDDSESVDWNIQYDLLDQEFIFAGALKRRMDNHPLLPLSTLLDGRLVNKHMRSLRALAEEKSWTEENLEIWEERADQLSYRFQQYRIPIVVMVTDNLNLAARTFQRINSQGTPMGEAHLVAALTWTSTFDLREKLSIIKDDFPVGWHELEDRILLQVCKGLVASDISKVDENQLIDGIRGDNSILDRAACGLQKAIDLLIRECHVVRSDLLPYSNQLIYLAIEFALREDETHSENHFVNWFWRTGWTEVFGSASFRQVRAEQEILRRIPPAGSLDVWKANWSAPKRFDSRHARIRVWMLRMVTHIGLEDEKGAKIDQVQLLTQYGKDSFAKLFQTPAGASPKLKALSQSVGNRFLIDPTRVFGLRKALLEHKNLSASFLRAHFISPVALTALREGELEVFLEERNSVLSKWDLSEWNVERKRSEQSLNGQSL